MSAYSKFIVALAGFLGVLASVGADGQITSAEAGATVTAAITAAAVFQVKNKPAEG